MTTYYVSTTGSDNANGSTAAPWRTIQHAVSGAVSGDTIIVRAGVYPEGVNITSSGITLRSETRAAAMIAPGNQGGYGINIAANNVTVDGFEVVGPARDAHAVQCNGQHHVAILNCDIHGAGGSGISFAWSEWITIDGNRCWDNSHASWYSGISVYECREIGGGGDGWRTIIRNNQCWANWTDHANGPHTDGNGIIIDDMWNSYTNGAFATWNHPTLVENNLCYRNGAKGIQVYLSAFVTVRNNTVLWNNGDVDNPGTWRGDLSVQAATDCTISGNVCVCDPATHPSSTAIGAYSTENTRNVWTSNLGWPADRAILQSGANNQFSGTIIADPQLDANYVPSPTGPAANIGWRPNAVLPPIDPPVPPVEVPDLPYNVNMLFSGFSPAGTPISGEGPYELGTRFKIAKAGTIKGIRFWRIAGNGAVKLRIWKGSVLLATKSVTDGATGWYEAAVSLAVAAGDEVIVSWGMPAGKAYMATNDMLAAEFKTGPLSVPAGGGVFATAMGQLPTQVWHNSCYWTDLRIG